jgi:hypothetical protein
MKRCCTCKSNLELSHFNKNRSKKDGLANQCKSCHKSANNKYILTNLEKYKRLRRAIGKNQYKKIRNTPERKISSAWRTMVSRCMNENDKNYRRYGARGIRVEWDSYQDFKKDMLKAMPEISKRYSLERINNEGNYNKQNCRWATRIDQANNRRTNIMIKVGEEIKTLTQWCRELHLSYDRIVQTIRKDHSKISNYIKGAVYVGYEDYILQLNKN